jgi:RecA-family ATPase
MTESIVQQFAQLLSETENDAKRAQLIKRAQMLAMNQAAPEAFEPPITTLGEYLDTPIEIPPALVSPTIVVRGELTATLGRAGYGKTTMNLNRIVRWAAGKPFFDTFTDGDGNPYLMPEKPLRILIIENEGSAGMFHHKMGVMVNNCGKILSDTDRSLVRENVMVWGDGGYSGLKLDDPAMLNKVRMGCEKHDPDILFIEPFRSLWKGEENSSTDMANMVDNLVALATDFSLGVVLSHHERKSGAGEDGELMSAGRGSTVLEGVVALMENWQKAKGGDYREITWSKARYLQAPPPTRVEYKSDLMWYTHVPMDEIENSVVAAISQNGEEPMSVTELSEDLQENKNKLYPILARLAEDGRLRKLPSQSNGEGSTGHRYRLPSGDNEDQSGGLAI